MNSWKLSLYIFCFQGACISYKPTFLRLAKDLLEEMEREVGEEMLVYAVSCQVHQELCDEYEIQDVPTMGLFKPGEHGLDSMKKLEHDEKNPDFIISYLFPDHGGVGNVQSQRGLAEAADSGGDEENEDEENENDAALVVGCSDAT